MYVDSPADPCPEPARTNREGGNQGRPARTEQGTASRDWIVTCLCYDEAGVRKEQRIRKKEIHHATV